MQRIFSVGSRKTGTNALKEQVMVYVKSKF